MSMRLAFVTACSLAFLCTACERESRRLQTSIQDDMRAISEEKPASAASQLRSVAAYERNAYELAEGKRLFRWYNCNGCHAQGGGGMGPALMDAAWIYGHEPDAIYATIMDGRPNGMPAFRSRVTERQARQLAAYVRSMSGLVAKDAAPGRNDGLKGSEPEARREREQPRLDPKAQGTQ